MVKGAAPAIDIGVLGPLRLRVGEMSVDVPGRRKRAVLSALAVQPGRPWSASELIDAVWGEEPPPTGRKALQVHMSELRRYLRECGAVELAAVIQTSQHGYMLDVDPEAVDAYRFTGLLAQAEAATEGSDVAALLTEALALWHGEPYPDLVESTSLHPEVERLATLRLAAEELRVSVALRAGAEPAVLAEAEAMVSEQPLRERRTVLLMAALFASGRQAEALAAFRRTAERLRGELGLEPGPELVAAELAVLRHDRAALGLSPGGELILERFHTSDGTPTAPTERELAAAVAVLGTRATIAAVGALLGIGGRALLEAIDCAVGAGSLDRRGQRLHLPVGLEEEVRNTIPSITQAELHQRAAEALVAHPIPDPVDHAVELAAHRLGALPIGALNDAIGACRGAGDSLSRADPLLAAGYYGHARSLVAQIPGDTGPTTAIGFAIAEAECLVRAGGADAEVQSLATHAADLAAASGDGELLAEAVLVLTQLRSAAVGANQDLSDRQDHAMKLLGDEPSSLRSRLLADRAASLILTDRRGERSRLARRALADARTLDDSFTLSEALTGLHQAEWHPNNAKQRLAWAEEASSYAEEAGSPTQRIHTRLYLVHDHIELGNLPEAVIALSGAEGLAATSGSARYRWATRAWRSLLELIGGRFDRAAELGDEAMGEWSGAPNLDAVSCRVSQSIAADLVRGHVLRSTEVLARLVGQNLDLVAVRAMLAYALAAAGDIAAASRQFEVLGPSPPAAVPDDPGRSLGLAMLLEAAVLLDELPVWVDDAVVDLESVSDHHIVVNVFGGGGLYWGVPSHQIGLVRARQGDDESARAWLSAAESAHARIGAEPWRARSASALGKVGSTT
ncbi:MAG: BTAD domain-containing putative transcriptional regulator [Acidimicrobiales bacterium]